MNTVKTSLATVVLLAGAVLAAMLPASAAAEANVIALSFHEADRGDECWDCICPGQFMLYVVLEDLSEPAVGAEFKVTADLPATIIETDVLTPAGVLYIVPPVDGEFRISFPEPAWGEVVAAAAIQYQVLGAGYAEWFLGPVSSPAVAGWPSYLPAADPETPIVLVPASGDPEQRSAWFTTDCDVCFPLAAEAKTWSAVRSLFGERGAR
ncbi:MAG: hypothetical protein R6X25_15905 [Candidatus Krumholzibacteriia bacterium]